MKPIAIFRHARTEGPGHFATFLERRRIPWTLVKLDAGDSLPERAAAFSGLALMGGPMSANDTVPWIAPEIELIRDAVRADIPVIGHCLGSQLMAKALGGAVTRNPVKEIGWGRVEVTNSDCARPWLGDVADFEAFHWHGETFSLPPGAVRILRSRYCENQMFVLGRHVGMQCHVEMTEELIRTWCAHGHAEIEANPGPAVQDSATIQKDMAPRVAALNQVAERIYTQWITGIKGERAKGRLAANARS
jgi:GMP synthase-like glutamine amidotransferase